MADNQENAAAERHGLPASMIRTGGRTERNRHAVAAGVLELLKAGDTDLTQDKVAEVSGVSRSTVYRRWPSRVALLREGLSAHARSLKISSTGGFDTDVYALARALARFLASPTEIAMSVAMVADDDSEFNESQIEFWAEHAESLLVPFTAAIKRGELSEDTDSAALLEMLMSPMIVRTVVMKQRLEGGIVDRLARQVIHAARSSIRD
ncbi:TetR-like C-terminal domain-containing protein [Mycobacterium sp.]|uniref:TetR-like C-terminal domain-containing protein n=1 Tax=Mycobacterium sp. TaxID=1785 RepID=UPI003BAA337F